MSQSNFLGYWFLARLHFDLELIIISEVLSTREDDGPYSIRLLPGGIGEDYLLLDQQVVLASMILFCESLICSGFDYCSTINSNTTSNIIIRLGKVFVK